jgi:kinesin family protein 2/24
VYGPDEDTQALYDELVKPLVEHAYAGGVGTFFAYGQTGSGKTFTVGALENLVAKDLLMGRNGIQKQVFVSIFELGGALNVAYGSFPNYETSIFLTR